MVNKQNQNWLDRTPADIEEQNHPSPNYGGGFFEIRIKGHLNSTWSDWLEGLEVKLLDHGEMVLSGPIADQAALMGILYKINRLNLTLLCVQKIDIKN